MGTRIEINCENGEVQELQLTQEEELFHQQLANQVAIDIAAHEEQEAKAAAAKASAEAKLAALGLTPEEIAAL